MPAVLLGTVGLMKKLQLSFVSIGENIGQARVVHSLSFHHQGSPRLGIPGRWPHHIWARSLKY